MRNNTKQNRSLTLAACAVALAAVVSPAVSWAHEDTVQQIQRYCCSSWQRAGIAHQDWEDCTQDTIVELLTRIGTSQLHLAIEDPLSTQRRELKRCVWCTVKRWQRATRWDSPMTDAVECEDAPRAQFPYSWDELFAAACRIVSPRQQQILALFGNGWAIPEIAAELRISTIQVSRSKHKALQRLRDLLPQHEQLS